MANLTEKEIMEKYALSPEKIEEIKDTIISVLSYDKAPSDKPLAIVVGGQSGAGKTALIEYTSQMSTQRNFVQIDNDFFRGFHPKAEEIKALYPDFYTAATDQIGLGITSYIIAHFMGARCEGNDLFKVRKEDCKKLNARLTEASTSEERKIISIEKRNLISNIANGEWKDLGLSDDFKSKFEKLDFIYRRSSNKEVKELTYKELYDLARKIIDPYQYNIILHQTLKNNRIADDAITKFREAGYTVGVRAFAVPYTESKMSQIERCLGQIDKLGFCRYVRKVDHDAAVQGLPRTVGYIEESGKYDFIEIFKRGKKIEQPTLVYARINPETEQATLDALSNCEQASHQDEPFGFASAQDAVEKTRFQEELRVAKTLDSRIADAESHPCNNPEMQTHIDELKDYFQQFKIEQGLTTTTSAIETK